MQKDLWSIGGQDYSLYFAKSKIHKCLETLAVYVEALCGKLALWKNKNRTHYFGPMLTETASIQSVEKS